PTWEEQADLLAKHVIENQSLDKLTMDDSGKTDAVSGVSINISEFVNLTKEVLQQASGQNNTSSTLKDGTYTTKSDEPSNGYTGVVTIEVTDGNITSLLYDSLDEQGQSKRYLSSVGEYVMVEGNPTWEEQADLLAKHVIENQSLDKLTIDDSGKTDAVSGVSINITEFVNLTKATLEKTAQDQ
ncbi:MAG: FMN-binding protein, partial [Clostridiales bacterium]|nr:FMN-binding protein [Clostridiales bacterium]